MRVNQPGDKFEQEADKMAGKVMRMPAPEEKIQKAGMPEEKIQKQDEEKVQKAGMPEEKIQKQDEEKIQKAGMPEEKIQKQDEEKIQKAGMPEEKIQKQDEEKIQKAGMPEEKIQKQDEEKIQKAGMPEEKAQKKGDEPLQRKESSGGTAVAAGTQASIQNKTTGGQPMSADVRGFMESRFDADFSKVRIHTDKESASLNNQLGARAFTYQNHIFFSKDQYQPGSGEGKQLLAHELTHTIQQGHAVQRSPQVTATASPPAVQRSVVGEILDWFADKAAYIPGFTMFTVILGVNPINMRTVDRSPANILRALIEFMPGGPLITQALENHGVFAKVSAWLDGKIRQLGMVGSMFKNALDRFIDSLGWRDLAPWNWGDVWNRAKRIFTEPIGRLISFARGVVTDIIKFVKDAILKPLAAMAEGTRGYDLLKAILGEDPITGEPVPRNADTLIGGFMKLIGQEEVWQNIKKGNAVARAWAWFQGALTGLMGFVRSIPGRIMNTIRSLTWVDIVTVAGAFAKIVGAFANIAGEFISWGFRQVLSLLEILFSVVAPGVLPYLKKAKGAFATILKNPIRFVGNLMRAAKLGFQMFSDNILTHLKTALIKWITGPLGEAGVYIPKSFSLLEIIKLVLSVLGLTWQNIRAKLVKIIPEPVLVVLEKTASILVTLVKEGPVAAWEQIKAELTELKDQLIAQVTEMITTEIVKAAVTKLATMLNPVGAVIQAIISIYNTITFFIEKINQIAAVVASFIDSIAAIAAGQVTNAAKKVERTMANTLVVVIGFLAKFAGLGGIPKKIVGIINKIRKPIDKGLDRIVGWLGGVLKKMAGGVAQAGVPKDPNKRLEMAANAAVAAARKLSGRITKSLLTPVLNGIKLRYGLKELEPFEDQGTWWVRATINPTIKKNTGQPTGQAGSGGSANLDRQGPLVSIADRTAAIAAMRATSTKNSPGITVISQLSDAKFTQYKNEYINNYAPGKNVGSSFQWPYFYLRLRAARRQGFDAESKWRPIVFPGSSPATFDIVRLDGSTATVIPDVLTGSKVGDIKNWGSISFTRQLQDFQIISDPKALSTSVKRNGRPYSAKRKFEIAVRHETHTQGETSVSGPLQNAVNNSGGVVHFVITDHKETVDEFTSKKNWPKR
jgi:hypothetical protein